MSLHIAGLIVTVELALITGAFVLALTEPGIYLAHMKAITMSLIALIGLAFGFFLGCYFTLGSADTVLRDLTAGACGAHATTALGAIDLHWPFGLAVLVGLHYPVHRIAVAFARLKERPRHAGGHDD